jgi:glycosyltransferase involved in cell wall biosynthesis
VLIIAYYWPPNAGVGVYRWLKFSKYLPQYGWQPVIYTPEHPEMQAVDRTLEKDIPPEAEIIRAPITEPYSFYKRFTGKRQDERLRTAFLRETAASSWKEDLALWLRSNLFIPDARVWWVKPSVRRLKKYLKENPVDVIVTTGSPHSLHLIGMQLKRATGITWIADFRDPWTNIDYYGQLNLTAWADRKHHEMERDVLQSADHVLTVSWTWARDLEKLGGRPVEVITNGYDPDDLPEEEVALDEEWSLVHVGSITATRDVPLLWKALADRTQRDADFKKRFKLRLVGGIDHTVLASIEEAGLTPWLERVPHVEHPEAIRHMQRARMLLLPVNNTPNVLGFLPAKVFEYLSVRRPILAIAPRSSDMARVLGNEHVLVDRNQDYAIREAVDQLFGQDVPIDRDPKHFSRLELTRSLASLLDRCMKKHRQTAR